LDLVSSGLISLLLLKLAVAWFACLPQSPLPRSTQGSFWVPAGAVFEVRELGFDLELTALGESLPLIGFPRNRIRRGYAEAPLQLTIRGREKESVPYLFTQTCQPPTAPQTEFRHRLEDIAELLSAGNGKAVSVAELQTLQSQAASVEDRLLAQRIAYQKFSDEGSTAEAAETAQALIATALEHSFEHYAAITQLNLAELYNRSGQHERARIELSRASELLDCQKLGYFCARASEARCMAIRDNKRADSATCYGAAVAQYEALGEISASANARYNQAYALWSGNRQEQARAVLKRALSTERALIRPVVLARLKYLETRIALRLGDLADAVDLSMETDKLLLDAGPQGSGWRVDLHFEVANLYAQLGQFNSAYRSWLKGFAVDPKPDAMSLAFALANLARLDLQAGQKPRAARFAGEAELRYRTLGMLKPALDMMLLKRRALRDHAEIDSNTLEQLRQYFPRAAYQVEHEQLLTNLSCSRAFDPRPRDIFGLYAEERVQFLRSSIDHLRHCGKLVEASSLIESELKLLDERAAAAESKAMAQLLWRSGAPLRRRWFDIAQQRGLSAEARWRFRLASEPSFEVSEGEKAATPSNPDIVHAQTEDAVLSFFARSQSTLRAHYFSLEQVQSALPAGTLLLTLVPTHDHTDALWLTRTKIGHSLLPNSSSLTRMSIETEELLHSTLHAQSTLQEQSKQLGEVLFKDSPLPQAPEQLWVWQSDQLTHIPWSIVRWPGTDSSLLSTTAISVVDHFTEVESRESSKVLTALIASDLGNIALPGLAQLKREHEILRSLTLPNIEINSGRRSTVEAARAALRSPGGWVHIASHGQTDSSLLGHSGVWLSPEPGSQSPRFLSALNIGESQVRSNLVVLNACSTVEDNADSAESSLSFASALVDAGAHHVVASRWSIHDGATAIWVPAFYQGMQSNDDPAEALRQAQLALARSLLYRHPHHWAGLMHLRRVRLEPRENESEIENTRALK
jgi:hypothetical protein